MRKHVVSCLVGSVVGTLFVVYPLYDYIHTDQHGQRFAVKPVAPINPNHAIYQQEWWRDPEMIRKVRAMSSHQTDAEFLAGLYPETEVYQRIAEVLRESTAPDADASQPQVAQ